MCRGGILARCSGGNRAIPSHKCIAGGRCCLPLRLMARLHYRESRDTRSHWKGNRRVWFVILNIGIRGGAIACFTRVCFQKVIDVSEHCHSGFGMASTSYYQLPHRYRSWLVVGVAAPADISVGAERARLVLRFFGRMKQSSKQCRYGCEQKGDFEASTRSRVRANDKE